MIEAKVQVAGSADPPVGDEAGEPLAVLVSGGEALGSLAEFALQPAMNVAAATAVTEARTNRECLTMPRTLEGFDPLLQTLQRSFDHLLFSLTLDHSWQWDRNIQH